MKTKFGIKNFRIFDEDGAVFNISPITILTGTNSAGKSSLAKACLLLESFLKDINFDIEKCRLDFMSYPLNTLGRYDKTVNKSSNSSKITFSYSLYSNYLFKDVDVTLVFDRDEHDELNNGLLDALSVSVENILIYSWSRTGGYENNYCNYNMLKGAFSDFISYEYQLYRMKESYAQSIKNMMEGFDEYYEDCEDDDCDMKESAGRTYDWNIFKSVAEHISSDNDEILYFGEKLDKEKIDWMGRYNSFFRFSMYEKTENMDANNLEEFLVSLVGKTKCRDSDMHILLDAARKLVDGFRESGKESFVDYIGAMEADFMNSDKCRDYHLAFWPFKLTLDTLMYNRMSSSKVYFSFNGPNNPSVFVINRKLDDVKVDFLFAYELLSVLDFVYKPEPEDYVWEYESEYGAVPVHEIYVAFRKYFNNFVKDCLKAEWNLTYVGSSRVNVEKMYSLEQKNSFTRLLMDYFNMTKTIKGKAKNIIRIGTVENPYIINSFTNKWIERFGAGKELVFKVDENGLGVQIFIRKEENQKPTLLAYEGYGITQLVSLILQIEVSILKTKGKFKNILGLEHFSKFHYQEQTIIIEEPEIHLHPKYQSLLADMFLEAYNEFGINFIIETHSEYLIRKTQVLVSKIGFESNEDFMDNNPFQTIYISAEKGPYSLDYRADGKFKNEFGPGFFDEAVNLMMEIF